jgi:ABC-type antimicrobial peptide transport system permease subunit
MQVATFREQKRAFMIGGMAIAAVSLLVSGIGIMNLMLAAIHERVREIGVRKALGAWSRDIFVQFVVESCTLSVCGGLVGIGLGFGLISVLQGNETIRPIFSVNAALVGFAFSVTVGVLAGLYPALKASRLDPIEALRYD